MHAVQLRKLAEMRLISGRQRLENAQHKYCPVIAYGNFDLRHAVMYGKPAERLAFVLHDVFGMTFDEIAPIVDRSSVATRQLASRARRRVQSKTPRAERDVREQRRVVDAFMAAAQKGDFEGLLAVLDPDIVLRADGGALTAASRVVRGSRAVAGQAAAFSNIGLSLQLVLVNGQLGFIARRGDGRLFSVIGFTIAGGKIVEMDILADPERLSRVDLSAVNG